MKRVTALALVLVLAGGCATGPGWPLARPPAPLLAKADRLAEQGNYEAAVTVYDEFLAASGDDSTAPRARMSRETAAAVVATRVEITRLKQELAKLHEELTKREADLAKVRDDLERLKQVDLLLEKRGKK